MADLIGKQSAATGTHFAHPTNKFWVSLLYSLYPYPCHPWSECADRK